MFLLVLALCCRNICQFRGNSEKSNHMLSATSEIELEFLKKFLNMSKLQIRLILLYQNLYNHKMSFFLLDFGFYTVDFDMDSCVLARFSLLRLRGRLPRLFCCFSGQVPQLKHAQPATSDSNEIFQFGRIFLVPEITVTQNL